MEQGCAIAEYVVDVFEQMVEAGIAFLPPSAGEHCISSAFSRRTLHFFRLQQAGECPPDFLHPLKRAGELRSEQESLTAFSEDVQEQRPSGKAYTGLYRCHSVETVCATDEEGKKKDFIANYLHMSEKSSTFVRSS